MHSQSEVIELKKCFQGILRHEIYVIGNQLIFKKNVDEAFKLISSPIYMEPATVFPELLKVLNVPSILNWTFQMFLKSAIVSTKSKHTPFLAGIFKERKSIF
jgi:hypothetical protein